MKLFLLKNYQSGLSVLIATIAWTMTPAVWAQASPAIGTSPSQSPAAPSEISKEELDAYVQARGRVEEIKARYNSRLDGTESAADMEELQDSANTEMSVAVTTAGLSLEKYNEIAMAAQADPSLRAKIQKALKG